MDNYELEIFLQNIEYSSRESIKKLIKNNSLSEDNIADIVYALSMKLKKIRDIVNIFEDFEELEYDEIWRK